MPSRRYLLAALLALPLLVAGCKINTINYFAPSYANVRMINLMPDAPALNVALGSTVVWSGVAFETATGYLDVENTTQTFTVSIPGASSSLVSATYNDISGESPYTLVAYGTVAEPQLVLINDTPVTSGGGRFQFRIANVAVGSPGIDVYVTSPDVPLASAGINFYNIGYGGVTQLIGLASGPYQVRAVVSGSSPQVVIYDSGARTFAGNTTVDFILYGKGSGVLLNAVDAVVYGQSTVANSSQARLKSVNATLQTGSVTELLDGTALTSNLAAATASVYATTTAAAHTIGYEATSTPGAVIASVAKTLGAATDTSVFVAGFPGAQTAIALADSNLPPQGGNASVRFVNASPDAAAVDVLVNGSKRVSALASYTASGYLQLAAGTYALEFVNASSGAVLLALAGTSLAADQVESVYLIGSTSSTSTPAFTGLVTRDR
jgi:hypothetical protein